MYEDDMSLSDPLQEAPLCERLQDSIRSVSQILQRLQESRGGQKRLLSLLAEQGGTLSQRTLMELTGVKSGSLSETLGKLESAGLVRRTQNESDRRSVLVTITEIGYMVEEEARERRNRDMQGKFSCLSEEEQYTLLSLLERLNASWREK